MVYMPIFSSNFSAKVPKRHKNRSTPYLRTPYLHHKYVIVKDPVELLSRVIILDLIIYLSMPKLKTRINDSTILYLFA